MRIFVDGVAIVIIGSFARLVEDEAAELFVIHFWKIIIVSSHHTRVVNKKNVPRNFNIAVDAKIDDVKKVVDKKCGKQCLGGFYTNTDLVRAFPSPNSTSFYSCTLLSPYARYQYMIILFISLTMNRYLDAKYSRKNKRKEPVQQDEKSHGIAVLRNRMNMPHQSSNAFERGKVK